MRAVSGRHVRWLLVAVAALICAVAVVVPRLAADPDPVGAPAYPMPITNQLPNPSFESGTSGWQASNATLGRRMDRHHRVDGRYAGVMRANRAGTTMQISAEADAPTTEHERVVSSVFLRQSSGPPGDATVRLTERTGAGRSIVLDSVRVRLHADFRGVTVRGVAVEDGGHVALEIAQASATGTEAVAVDAATLAPTTAALGLLALDDTQMDPKNLGEVWRYDYVVVQVHQHGHSHATQRDNLVDQIHAAARAHRSATKVLVYENVAAMGPPTSCAQDPFGAQSPFGVDYCYADTYHGETSGDDWFLHQAGVPPSKASRLMFSSYPENVYANIGSASYRERWAANVLTRVAAEGFDGVYLDDVNTYPGTDRNGQVAEYPPFACADNRFGNCERSYGDAMTSFVAEVGDRLHAAGLITIANVASNLDPPQAYQQADVATMADHLDVISREFWTRFGDYAHSCVDPDIGPLFDEGQIARRQAYARMVQDRGTSFAGLDYSSGPTDTTRMTYGRAAFLLAWNGVGGSAYFLRTCPHSDPANDAWTTSPGLPAEPDSTDDDGLFSRQFVDGCARSLVLLNTASTAATYFLDGTYTTELGQLRSGALFVPPRSGTVLRETSCNPPG